MVGKVHFLLGLLSITIIVMQALRRRDVLIKIQSAKLIITFIGLLSAVYMILPVSLPVWEFLTPLAYVQYPWRFLVFISFWLSVLGGGVVLLFDHQDKKTFWIIIVFVITIVGFNQKYFRPQFITQGKDTDYTSIEATNWKISKISDEYLPREFPIPNKIDEIALSKFIPMGDIIALSSEVKTNRIKLNVSAQNRAEIVFNIANFPGWQAVVDTEKVVSLQRERSLVVPVEKGTHVVSLSFTNTWIRNLGNIISLIGILSILILCQVKQKNLDHGLDFIKYEKN